VVARASAFELKNQSGDMKAIAETLHATHLIKGSVRKAGTRLRITAQLINAESSVSIWTDSYDREYADVFAVQEDIARAIAASLRMPLGLNPGENLVANRNIDVELYQQFLRLRARAHASTGNQIVADVLPELEKLVARDPNFAPAWADLARLSGLVQVTIDRTIWTRPPEATRRLIQPANDKMEKAAREAIRLDPRQALAYAGLAFVELNRKRWAAADDLFRKALELDPYDTDVLSDYGRFLHQTGRIKGSLQLLQQARALDPLVRIYALDMASVLMADNQPDAAIAMLEAVQVRTTLSSSLLAQAYSMAGRFDDAANTILLFQRNFFGDPKAVEEAARLIRSAPTKVSDPSALPALQGRLDFVYGFAGAPERLLDYPERAMQANDLAMVQWFAQNYVPVRKTERFKKLVREAGLVDYWKARGWPDLCRPTAADDFVCE
jgi:tetratricopeptide (TPR) repeat protein